MMVQVRGGAARKTRIVNGSSEGKSGLAEDSESEGEEFELEGGGNDEKESLQGRTTLDGVGRCWDWMSSNLFKVFFVMFPLVSLGVLMLWRNRGEEAALLCIQSITTDDAAMAPYPDVDFGRVRKAKDFTRYADVSFEQWVVLAVSGPPTEEVQAFTRLKGWYVLAVAIGETPADWRIPNVIFLSFELQAQLGYRINKYLPFDSYIRKNIGYLFAIQHGAKRIYDADSKGTLLQNDLAKIFDVQLSGPDSRREPVLQYRYFDTRHVVNPYVHFGQKSIWPRGMPLESVSEIDADIWYAKVTSGKQYIQQSLTNGLPDIDSVFYYTRKSQNVDLSVQFDSFAPRITLPQGLMAPVNSLNTLFQSSALWALLLPVSGGSRISDVSRGYWAQRLIWEVGGVLGVYPPAIRRKDFMEAPLVKQEMEFYGKVNKLITFLLHWRSDKSTLFQRILHLSHSMAVDGFWMGEDVQLTAAWLQDLVSVGYVQPRLFTHELGRNRTSWSSLGHDQFLPHSFQAPYLGLEDLTGMASSMADLTRWRHFWGNVVLVLECTGPSNHTVFGWRMFYARLFKHIVILGPEEDKELDVIKITGESYKVFADIFDHYPNSDGFLFIKDDVVLNYWNFLKADKKKLWNVHKVSGAWQSVGLKDTGSEWFHGNATKQGIRKVLQNMPPKYHAIYRKGRSESQYVMSPSRLYYVPQKYVTSFITMITPVKNAQLRSEVAIPFIFQAIESPDNYDSSALSTMLYINDNEQTNPKDVYRSDLDALHPWRAKTEGELTELFKLLGRTDTHLLDAFD